MSFFAAEVGRVEVIGDRSGDPTNDGGGCEVSSQDHGPIFMVSPINALLEGLYETPLTLFELAKHGDFGIGTFNDLDGEMLRVDGVTYQLDLDGQAHQPPLHTGTPFAAVCKFKPYASEPLAALSGHVALEAHLDQCLLSRNMMFAIRVDARFSWVRTRSVPKTHNYTPLVEATALQKVTDFKNISGTMVGFYTPAFMPSINVPGYHFHFISQDRLHGGHLFDFELIEGQVSLQLCSQLVLNLPMTTDYLGAEFLRDARADIEKAFRAPGVESSG